MTENEMKEVFAVINALYPNAYDFTNKIVVRAWSKKLINYEKPNVMSAIETRYSIDSRWLNFGDILDILNNTTVENNVTWGELQSEIRKYIGTPGPLKDKFKGSECFDYFMKEGYYNRYVSSDDYNAQKICESVVKEFNSKRKTAKITNNPQLISKEVKMIE